MTDKKDALELANEEITRLKDVVAQHSDLPSLGAEIFEQARVVDTHVPIHLKDSVNPSLETLRLVAFKLGYIPSAKAQV